MTAPSKIRAARNAKGRCGRVRQMADVMRHHAHGPDTGCTYRDLASAGFTQAEIEAYADDARRLLADLPPVVLAPSFAQREGARLVRAARRIRARYAARQAS